MFILRRHPTEMQMPVACRVTFQSYDISYLCCQVEIPDKLVLRQFWGNFILFEIKSPSAAANQIQLCHTFAV